jgi:hypothetical protein
VLKAGLPMSVHQLPVNGEDLKHLGLSGAAIGDMLTRLHENVLQRKCPCEHDTLLAFAEKLIDKK